MLKDVTYCFCLALRRLLDFWYHFIGDDAAVEIGAFVQFIDSDQPVDVSVCRRGTFHRSVLLLILRVSFGVLATFPREEIIPNLSVFG